MINVDKIAEKVANEPLEEDVLWICSIVKIGIGVDYVKQEN